jgi:translation initiation factor IF-3
VEVNIVKAWPINQQIRAAEVLLIGEEGERIGVTPLTQALQIAQEKRVDLVEVAPNATPPVCRLIDYGRYKYQQAKKEREAHKGQRSTLVREIRIRPKIDRHDLEAKIRLVERLLAEDNKVKVSVFFRGREITHPELGKQILQKVLSQLEEVATVKQPLDVVGKSLSITFSPKPAKASKRN